jgi:hypothetical protein
VHETTQKKKGQKRINLKGPLLTPEWSFYKIPKCQIKNQVEGILKKFIFVLTISFVEGEREQFFK